LTRRVSVEPALHHDYKEEVAQAVAVCELDPVIVRSEGKEGLFEEEFYSKLFPTGDPLFYSTRYRSIGNLAEVNQGYTSVASERSGCSVQSSLLAVFDRLGFMPAAALQATCAASRASSSVLYSYCPSAWTAPPLTVPPSVPVASIKRIRTKKGHNIPPKTVQCACNTQQANSPLLRL